MFHLMTVITNLEHGRLRNTSQENAPTLRRPDLSYLVQHLSPHAGRNREHQERDQAGLKKISQGRKLRQGIHQRLEWRVSNGPVS